MAIYIGTKGEPVIQRGEFVLTRGEIDETREILDYIRAMRLGKQASKKYAKALERLAK